MLPRSTSRADHLPFAGPLSGRDLVSVTGVVPDPAMRSGKRPAALTGPVGTLSAAFVDAAMGSRPAGRPAPGFGGRYRGCRERQGRRGGKDYCFHRCSPLISSAAVLASATAMKVAVLFCPVFAGRPANIAIYCRPDLPLAPRGRGRDNCRYVGKQAPNPHR